MVVEHASVEYTSKKSDRSHQTLTPWVAMNDGRKLHERARTTTTTTTEKRRRE